MNNYSQLIKTLYAAESKAAALNKKLRDTQQLLKKALDANKHLSKQVLKPLSESYVRKLESDAYRYKYGYSEVVRMTEQAHGIGTSHEPA